MKDLFSVKDKVVVITGGTGVLGRSIAEHLAEQGAHVVILGRNKELGESIAEAICKQGGDACFLVSDVMNQEVVEQNCADVLSRYGRVDALLNAAGGNMPGATIPPTGNFFGVKIEDFQKVLNLIVML